MGIDLHLLLKVLDVQLVRFSNLKRATSTPLVQWLSMDMCDREVKMMAFTDKLPLNYLPSNNILLG